MHVFWSYAGLGSSDGQVQRGTMVLSRPERDTIQEEPETLVISNKPLTPKTRYHMDIDEGVCGIRIYIVI